MEINKSTVYNWIKKLYKKTENSACSQEEVPEKPQTVDVIEMDELFSYTKAKNRTYVITSVTRKPRQIVGFDVAYGKSESRTQKIVNNSIKTKLYYSDANPSYQKVSYSGQHFFFRDKSHTFTVESVNADLRKYIAVLQRKSKCFFRSLEAFQAIMRVFVYAYNKFGGFKQRFPRLKSAVGLIIFFALSLNFGNPLISVLVDYFW